ncbi:hypothetical protein MRBLWH7_002292 [Microbacterium sp. LWH7-1.2]|uniref:hypothetical protein n=1 Tax=Microbacterium sp. LWH7-1.2 TaxID=3135257 RepID=UPI003138E1D0
MTSATASHVDQRSAIEWTHPRLHLRFDHDADHPVSLVHWSSLPDAPSIVVPSVIVDLSVAGEERERHNQSLLLWGAGRRLRYTGHDADGDELRIDQHDPLSGLEVTSVFRAAGPGVQLRHVVRNGAQGETVLLAVSSALVSVPALSVRLPRGAQRGAVRPRVRPSPSTRNRATASPGRIRHGRSTSRAGTTT